MAGGVRDERDAGTIVLAAMMCNLPRTTGDGMTEEEGDLKARERIRLAQVVVTIHLRGREDSMTYVGRDQTEKVRVRGTE